MIQSLFHAIGGGMFSLAQLKPEALKADPALLPDGSSVMTMVMAAIIVAGVVAIAFRPAKRDRASS